MSPFPPEPVDTTRSVSAANEVKLAEAEKLLLNEAADMGGKGWALGHLYRSVERILGARLSAREPDNETVERRMEIAWNQGRKVGMEHGYETTGPHSNPYRSAARTAAFDYLATLKTTAPVETPPPAVPVSGVPTEAVRELAERVAAVVQEMRDEANKAEHLPSPRHYMRVFADRVERALVQRAAETNPSRSDTEGGER